MNTGSGIFDFKENLKPDCFVVEDNIIALTSTSDEVWEAIKTKDLEKLSEGFKKSFEAQIKMFPTMVNDRINAEIHKFKDKAMAWKLAGAGGGGYLILVSETPIEGIMKINIRRKEAL